MATRAYEFVRVEKTPTLKRKKINRCSVACAARAVAGM